MPKSQATSAKKKPRPSTKKGKATIAGGALAADGEQRSTGPIVLPPPAPVGVRLNPEDREFLATRWPDTSISEALRNAVDEVRSFSTPPTTVEEAEVLLRGVIGKFLPNDRDADGSRSTVVSDMVREAIHLLAVAIVKNDSAAGRKSQENQLVHGGFDIMHSLLRHALPDQADAWDPRVVRDRLGKSRQVMVQALSVTASEHKPRSETLPGEAS